LKCSQKGIVVSQASYEFAVITNRKEFGLIVDLCGAVLSKGENLCSGVMTSARWLRVEGNLDVWQTGMYKRAILSLQQVKWDSNHENRKGQLPGTDPVAAG
jgi:hypothetical protein